MELLERMSSPQEQRVWIGEASLLTARASRTRNRVLGLGLLAAALESRLVAAGALGLGSADAGFTSFAGAATARARDSHGICRRIGVIGGGGGMWFEGPGCIVS